MQKHYDVIVVGGGHAGCEAAAAAANLGSKTLLITMNMATIGQMSCNPAMGGVAKGQIVREIDALGGYSGIVSDKSMIQFRMLNRSKGPAMWSPRSQNDRYKFAYEWRMMLERTENLDFWQDTVNELIVENETVCGVKTSLGIEFRCKAVVLTNGTFLNGLIHIGEKNFGGGRSAEKAATGLTENLNQLGFESGRMKTGTPPRLDGRSINYSVMEEQPGDENPSKFSFTDTPKLTHQRSCHLAYTNDTVHDILRGGFEKSPMFSGRIQGIGPRYCPSIEDKIERFSDKNRHQLFVEPEGWDTVEVYLNGFSTSLPEDVQYEALRHIPGMENAKMFRPGYAIEYDYFPPTQLTHTLETKLTKNLFFAGQINGTTGYEEAACQGLMAGINAHQTTSDKEPFILTRSQAYIGVLIDDLITKGTEEPYRMFTSRAEHRILLRQDNADVRLTALGHNLGLASEESLKRMETKVQDVAAIEKLLGKHSLETEESNPYLTNRNSNSVKQKLRAYSLISRPEIDLPSMINEIPSVAKIVHSVSNNLEVIEQVEIQAKYSGYIQKEQDSADKILRFEGINLKLDFDYNKLESLSAEARQKLTKIRPKSIGQASRISGVSPSDISVLLVHLGK
ncbi:MAG: tRNA uridine-5-carboxymethylaminomethyl(34) synthesis enzyme MnmG [Flavobacteriales bacterium]|nr:tRNA uridine-5-carboxymethylaminomethyl(34) synthesis enzyme MnmG [Flavobacteriales bacterium]